MDLIIQGALHNISVQFTGPEMAWLAESNPVAMRQLDDIEEKINAAYKANDVQAVRKWALAWEQTWIFWIKNYRRK